MGSVFISDTAGLHSASQIIENPRVITQIRFGKKYGYSSVVYGFCQTPNSKQLFFFKR